MSYDVIVVGGGDAGMCAALSAHEHGAKVLVLERAPEDKRGGNTASPVAASAWSITARRTSNGWCPT